MRLLEKEKEKEKKAKGKKQKIPFYFSESLPDKKLMPMKRMVAKIPDSVERPSAEVMNQMVTHLYKDELSRKSRVN